MYSYYNIVEERVCMNMYMYKIKSLANKRETFDN